MNIPDNIEGRERGELIKLNTEREKVILSTIKDIRKIMDKRNLSLYELKMIIEITEDVIRADDRYSDN